MSNKEIKKKANAKTRFIVMLVAGIAVLLAAAYLIFCQAVQSSGIWRDVSVNGVQLKGLSIEEAEQAVQQKFEEEYQDAAVTVTLDGQEYRIPLLC